MTDKEKELQAEAIDYYRKRIAELEKKNRGLDAMLTGESLISNERKEQLTKAKEIIKYLLSFIQKENYKTRWDINIAEAEQFLKNDGCPDVMCEDCTKEDCGIKKLGLVEVEK